MWVYRALSRIKIQHLSGIGMVLLFKSYVL